MKIILGKLNSKDQLIPFVLLAVTSVIMIIENMTSNTSELYSTIMCIVALALGGFSIAVRAFQSIINRNLSNDLIVTICSFAAFILGFYQTGVISLLIYEFLRLLSDRTAHYVYNNSRTDCLLIKSDSKKRVRLSEIKKNDRFLVRAGTLFPFDCCDEIDETEYKIYEVAEKDTIITAPSESLLMPTVEYDNKAFDKLQRIAYVSAFGLILLLTVIYVVIGVISGSLELTIYKFFASIIAQPIELLYLTSSNKYVPIIVFGVLSAIFSVLTFIGFLPMWVSVLIRFAVVLAIRVIISNNKVKKI